MDTDVHPSAQGVQSSALLPPLPPAFGSHVALSAALQHLRSGIGRSNVAQMDADEWSLQANAAIRTLDGALSELIAHRNRAAAVDDCIDKLQKRIAELETRVEELLAEVATATVAAQPPDAHDLAHATHSPCAAVPVGDDADGPLELTAAGATALEQCPDANLLEESAALRDLLRDSANSLAYLNEHLSLLSRHCSGLAADEISDQIGVLFRFARVARDRTLLF